MNRCAALLFACRAWGVGMWAVLLLPLVLSTGPALAEGPAGPRPISLEEAQRTALERSPDLEAAAARIAAARGAITQAQSAFLPTLTVGETYVASNDPVQAFMMTLKQRAFDFTTADFNHPGTIDDFGTRVVARWQLFNGGRDIASRSAARLGVEAAADEFAAARNTLVFEVTRAFYETVKARRFVTAAAAEVTNLESNHKLAQDRRSEGAALATDVLDINVRLSTAREELVRARGALSLAEAVLTGVIGGDSADPVTAAEPHDALDAEAPATARGNRTESSERAELASARKTLAQAEERVRMARAARFPRLSAFAGYDVDSGNLSDFADSWATGVNVEMDIFDGGRTSGAIATAQAQRDTAAAEVRRVEIALGIERQRAEIAVRETTARVATTADAVGQAELSLSITRDRYREGLALVSQVLDAETALRSSRERRAAALMDQRIALAALDKALGLNQGADWSTKARGPKQ